MEAKYEHHSGVADQKRNCQYCLADRYVHSQVGSAGISPVSGKAYDGMFIQVV